MDLRETDERPIWERPVWTDGPVDPAGLARLKDENAALLEADFARRSPRLRGLPEVVMLNHTDACNLRCVMCPRHESQGESRLPVDVLRRIAARLFPTARKLGLAAAYAEPTAFDFEELVGLAARYGARVDLTTNGTLLDLARYRAARDVLDHLDISIDSHVPATYEAIRVGARFEQVRDHVYAVRDERKRRPDDVLLTVSAVVMRSNLDHLPGLIAFAAEAGASGVILKGLNRATPTAEGEDPYAAFGAERVALALAACRRAALEHGINLLRLTGCAEADGAVSVFPRPSRLPLGPTSRLDGLCWYLGQNFHVLHTGEVYPCLMPTTHVAGDVYRDDPIAVWNGPVLTALRAAHYARRQTPFCSGCVHAPHLPAADAETRSVEEASRAARRAAYPV